MTTSGRSTQDAERTPENVEAGDAAAHISTSDLRRRAGTPRWLAGRPGWAPPLIELHDGRQVTLTAHALGGLILGLMIDPKDLTALTQASLITSRLGEPSQEDRDIRLCALTTLAEHPAGVTVQIMDAMAPLYAHALRTFAAADDQTLSDWLGVTAATCRDIQDACAPAALLLDPPTQT